MSLTTNEQVLAVRKAGGYLFLDTNGLIEISGKDAASYLHGRSSNNVTALEPGQGQLNSLLDRKGYILAFFSLYRLEANYLLLTEKAQVAEILKQFETYHFREEINFRDLSDATTAIAVQGPLSESLLDKGLTQGQELPPDEFGIGEFELWQISCRVIKRSLTGELGYIILVEQKDRSAMETAIKNVGAALNIVPIDQVTLDILRVETGIPQFGLDMSQEEILPETGLEQYAASYNKGCFQGQEVLARIKTYGAPKRALVGLIFAEGLQTPFAGNTNFEIGGEPAGTIKSCIYSPTLGRVIALAYISREYRVPDKEIAVRIAGIDTTARVSFLPIYTPKSNAERAKKLFNQALAEFAHGSEEKAIAILRQVIEADPHFIDAYEALGVVLARQEQLDEAIALMHSLMQLDPDSVMAHSNLSLFYMQQGDKEKAEEEKAIAMGIRMSKIAKEVAAKQKADQDKVQKMEAAKERMSMFQQVLEIDKNDLLANYGLGSIYVELGEYEQSLSYLLKALEIKPTHSVAYLALGQAYENLNRYADAQTVYQTGIEIAAKRGDLMPMNEMKSRQAAISHLL
ncbi:MAG: tetratricopeptide repeat protein [Candidatus Obscuribacterales bacterium]|nr:tetratricopeptide repeat protein [Candidatus Obscuribacterales bacterium]